MKPLLSNKIVSNEKITRVEGEEIIKIDQANAKVLNKFFSNIIANSTIQSSRSDLSEYKGSSD